MNHIISRLLDVVVAESDGLLFHHSLLAQTSLPYKNPGDLRRWTKRNGKAVLELNAGRALSPITGKFIDVGLPFGPKPRLVLIQLNTEAIRTQSPIIHLEDSLTAFVKRTLGLDGGGRNIRLVKEQLKRLSASNFQFGYLLDNRAITINGTVISGFDLWAPKNPNQRVLFPTQVRFSQEYFDSLVKHAVPLSENAIRGLSHSSVALDTYTWLAQRLHRVQSPINLPWATLKNQFGEGFSEERKFKRFFLKSLREVTLVYPEANLEPTADGLILRNSPPPVLKTQVQNQLDRLRRDK